ncbi:MAG TPA: CocE/NonD family hydrolase [Candidatus Saccharimonadales bacterium]|nr:CocE/NonD family hydrolase [Candidatus Saccharimonadales bacterium]
MTDAVLGRTPSSVVVEADVEILARDGTVLRADVYRPADGRHPVLLGRTPYGKRTWAAWMDPVRTASEGFVVVVNDLRGHHGSDGTIDPFRTDVPDGYDVVEWCGAQPWSNGRVVMFGSSAGGFVQLQAAIAHPPSLAAIAPMQTWSSFGRGCCYDPGGAFSLYTREWTLLIAALDPARRMRATDPGFAERHARAARAQWEIERWNGHRPLSSFPPVADGLAPYLPAWLDHPDHDDWWADRDTAPGLPDVKVPALHIVGWFDRFCRTTLENHRLLGSSEQRLIIGPWPHGVPVITSSGDQHYGPAASVDARRLVLDWAERFARDGGAAAGIAAEDAPRVRLWVLGAETWRDEPAWPLARARDQTWYLRSGGRANTREGDGMLTGEAPPLDEPADTYVHDPSDPVPSVPGRAMRHLGSVDQGPIEDRADVLCYSSDPLDRAVEVTGHVKARLYAASTAPDTDWVVKLVDVHPDGHVFRLVDGMIRARYRDSQASPRLLEPGRAYAYDIDVGPISNLFRAGHRIRIEVASASFSEYDPNLNTGGVAADEMTGVPATQRILHDAEHASHIVLPVVPSAS